MINLSFEWPRRLVSHNFSGTCSWPIKIDDSVGPRGFQSHLALKTSDELSRHLVFLLILEVLILEPLSSLGRRYLRRFPRRPYKGGSAVLLRQQFNDS